MDGFIDIYDLSASEELYAFTSLSPDQLIRYIAEEIDIHYYANEKYKKYYEGKHKILYEKIKTDPNKSDQRAVLNYCKTSVDNHVGYILGKPVTFTSNTDDDSFRKKIKQYLAPFEHHHNIGLDTDAKIYGKAYEVRYIDKGIFKLAYFSPLEMQVVTDGTIENKIKVAVRKYRKLFDANVYVDVWDDLNFSTYLYNNEELTLISSNKHLFSSCPVSELKINSNGISIIDQIIDVQDSLNNITTDIINEIRDNRLSYLMVSGVNLSDADKQLMLERNVINDPEGGEIDVKYITHDMQGQFVLGEQEFLRKRIYELTHQIDFTENPPSNTSSLAIVARQQNLENLCAIYISYWTKLLHERLVFFAEYLKIKEDVQYDPYSVDISFSRNIPTDEKMAADIIKTLFGIAPTKRLLGLFPKWDNPDLLMEELRQEKAQSAQDQAQNSTYADVPFHNLTSNNGVTDNGQQQQQ